MTRPGSSRRVVFFPHGGGGASFYHPLARALPDDIEGVLVQYPGREDRINEPPPCTMEQLADSLTEAVGVLFDRPVWFFGHSMGASVAHEVTRRLTVRSGPLPKRLVVSGRPGPSRQTSDDLHLDDERLWNDVCRLGGTDSQLLAMPEVRAMVLPAIRADYRLVETYRPTRATDLTVPVSCCYGENDPEVSRLDAEAWREATTDSVDVHSFPGGHFYLRNESEAALIDWLASEIYGRSQQ
ncbi:alpha/beta fold hydrolase [Dermacoccus sp. Tok2021]|uniref:thioesterase II family protein n=1 Tax=Dermacoccus sp. Tok2021 TaxID=2826873 RepID=UPI001CA6D3F5|nr:alpha/beta fold hydrolase [Dermacoccus sp. Tok2021]